MNKVISTSKNQAIEPPPRRRVVRRLPEPILERSGDAAISKPVRRSSFRKSDIWRALSAAQKGGANVTAMEIGRDGSIRLSFNEAAGDAARATAFDDWADRL
jgi:hypothetical protein